MKNKTNLSNQIISVKISLIFKMVILFICLLFQPYSLTAQQIFTGVDDVEVKVSDTSRIVSIGSAITEILFKLGVDEQIIAVDESSTYPEDGVKSKQKVSYTRTLSAEGILSTSPSLILASESAGPKTAIQQIRSTGVPMLLITSDETVEGAFKRVLDIGEILGKEEKANDIIKDIKSKLDLVKSNRETIKVKPKVLFIYARGQNNMMVAGNNTSAKTVIELAGGTNAFSEFNGYKPLTSEAVVSANPDIILMMNSGIRSVGGKEGVLKSPGISLTNAAKNNRIYAMDDTYLLSFGPRLGNAILDLMQILHPTINFVES